MSIHIQPHRRTLLCSLLSSALLATACGGGGGGGAASTDTSDETQDMATAQRWSQRWGKVATEGQGFTVAASTYLRYGTGSQWVYKTVSGNGQCSNGFFGQDPAVGLLKECDAHSALAPAP